MFGAEAVREADRAIDELHRKHRWEVVVQTIDSLEGKDIKDRALEEARALKVHGLLVLIAKRDHKVWIEPAIRPGVRSPAGPGHRQGPLQRFQGR